MIFRKTLIIKFTLISTILLISIYLFTYHNEKIQPSYDSLKNGLVWNKDESLDSSSVTPTDSVSSIANKVSPDLKDNKNLKKIDDSINENLTKDIAKNLESENDYSDDNINNNNDNISNKPKNKYFDDIENYGPSDETNVNNNLDWDDKKKAIIKFVDKQSKDDPLLPKRTKVFNKIFELISDCKPTIKPLDKYPNGKCGVEFVHGFETPYFTKENLLDYLVVTEDDKNDLIKQHENLINNLPENYIDSIYEKDSKGIVYVGGNKYSWLTLLSIINLRRNHCRLPIEVMIPKYEEFELNICENILPKYDAKCIYLPKLVSDEIYEKYNFKGYQYKSLALSLSSFENVLLLDADNTALTDPEPVFHSNPFIDHGLLLWPDFWKRTTHPSFYDIIGIKIDETKRRNLGYSEYGKSIKPVSPDDVTLYHQLENALPDPTTESGQLFISKKKHFKTLILSLYYNTYGPDYYYPLLSQGAAGEGDKETFIAAAHALGESYYNIKRHVIPLGRFRNGEFHGSAMGQADPIGDYILSKKFADSTEEVTDKPDFLFIHSNFPKMDPWSLKKDDIIFNKETGERNRLFGEGFIDEAKFDFELAMWEIMSNLECDEKIEFYTFKNDEVDINDVCAEILEHLKYLRSTTKKIE